MWDLWRILTIDGRLQIAVTLNGVDKTLLFTTTSVINGSQVVTFADPQVKVKKPGCDYVLMRRCHWVSVLGEESYNFNMTGKILSSYFKVSLLKERNKEGKLFLDSFGIKEWGELTFFECLLLVAR